MSGQREQAVPPRPPVSVRGRGRNLRVSVERAAPPDELTAALRSQLERKAGGFFAGAPVTLELPGDSLDAASAMPLVDALAEAGMQLVRIETRGAADEAREMAPAPQPSTPMAGTGAEEDRALVIHGTLRSGQRIAHDGPVLVLGDVNPGAEVVSGGSVVVWGRLRGTIEAGRIYDQSRVCALDLCPTQLRIGQAIARAPEEPERIPVPEEAREVDGRIVVESWR